MGCCYSSERTAPRDWIGMEDADAMSNSLCKDTRVSKYISEISSLSSDTDASRLTLLEYPPYMHGPGSAATSVSATPRPLIGSPEGEGGKDGHDDGLPSDKHTFIVSAGGTKEQKEGRRTADYIALRNFSNAVVMPLSYEENPEEKDLVGVWQEDQQLVSIHNNTYTNIGRIKYQLFKGILAEEEGTTKGFDTRSHTHVVFAMIKPMEVKPLFRYRKDPDNEVPQQEREEIIDIDSVVSVALRPPNKKELEQMKCEASEKISKELKDLDEAIHRNIPTTACSSSSSSVQDLALCAAVGSGKKFIDTQFPPQPSSVYRAGAEASCPGDMELDGHDYRWLRPEDAYPLEIRERIRLFGQTRCDAAVQGKDGDGWLHAACVSVARRSPEFLYSLFLHPLGVTAAMAEQRAGAVRLLLNVDGWWRYVLVDSHLPCQHFFPAFSFNRQHPAELWMPYVEKAFAKLCGSYWAALRQSPVKAFTSITGFPSFLVKWGEEEEEVLFRKLEGWIEALGYPVAMRTCCRTPALVKVAGDQTSPSPVPVLLAAGHCWCSVSRVVSADGSRFVKFSHPRGAALAADAGRDMRQESPAVRKACGPAVHCRPGDFWLRWTDVIRCFDQAAVCSLGVRETTAAVWDYRMRSAFVPRKPALGLRITCTSPRAVKAYVTLRQPVEASCANGATDPCPEGAAAVQLSLWRKLIPSGNGAPLCSAPFTLVAFAGEDPDIPVTAAPDHEEVTTVFYHHQPEIAIRMELEQHVEYLVLPHWKECRRREAPPSKEEDPCDESAPYPFILSFLSPKRCRSNRLEVDLLDVFPRSTEAGQGEGEHAVAVLDPHSPNGLEVRLVERDICHQERQLGGLLRTAKGRDLHSAAAQVDAPPALPPPPPLLEAENCTVSRDASSEGTDPA